MINKRNRILLFTRSSESGGEAVFIRRIKKILEPSQIIKVCSLLDCISAKREDAVSLQPVFIFGKPFLSLKSLIVATSEVKKADTVLHFVFDIHSLVLFMIGQLNRKINIVTFHTNLISRGIIRHPYSIIIKFLAINYFAIFADKAIFITSAQLEGFTDYCLFKKKLKHISSIVNNFVNNDIILSKKTNHSSKVLFVGRYTKIKGFEDLVALAEKTKEVDFTLVGDNSYVPNLPNIVNSGQISNDLVLKEMDNNSILILPSYAEVFPMTILEAMARGCVILVSDITGMREIIQDGRNGYLFPAGDIEKMEEIILYLKNHPSEIERISENNLEDIWKFTAEKQTAKYIRLYGSVLR